ncbi:PREDICTED: farnesol dehydrogenase [Drosophila arizonae]|uniref:Farnesol dehydrogenase n=1 Tax=Drosophila arizonae TaxID=7263 RepID=A0ABM1PUE7_DROAR|nr:PREDICTED: farnesol dehydrogenase [Drosophila arizonae]XP_017870833.1 PREDICTED: farnesol dehydrogenase [Drosophila arizonae]
MDRWQNRVAVITGASSGIGAACAKVLVAAGLQVVGLARRTERLEQLRQSLPKEQQARFHQRTCDVSAEAQVNSAFEWIEQQLGGIDVLINNAGILRDGHLLDMPTKDITDVLQTNLMGSIYCTKLAASSMRRRQVAGHLFFINSTAGLAGYNPGHIDPSLNIYTPSKFALTAVHEICRQELITQKLKIKTTSIFPGWVSTEIVPDETKAQLGDVILQADDVAQAMLYALSTPPHTQVQEITLRAVGEWY